MAPAQFTLKLTARHFRNTEFCIGKCAIEKALEEKFNRPCIESIYIARVGRYGAKGTVRYWHDSYGRSSFDKDKKRAHRLGYRNIIIRQILFKMDF